HAWGDLMIKRLGLLTLLLAPVSASVAQTPAEIKGFGGLVHALAVSPDGTLLATGDFNFEVKVWDLKSGKLLHTLKGHTGPIHAVTSNKDSTLLASAGNDMIIRLWNAKEGKPVREMKGHGDLVHALAFSPDGSLLASAAGDKDKTVRLWNP